MHDKEITSIFIIFEALFAHLKIKAKDVEDMIDTLDIELGHRQDAKEFLISIVGKVKK